MGSRQIGNLWWYLGSYSGGKWRGWHLFDRRFWARNGFILHDSFGKFWSQWVTCPLLGHRNIKQIKDDNGYLVPHCFACEETGPVSKLFQGTPDHPPYIPSWCYDSPGPAMCECGHHEGYHNDAGVCLHTHYFSCCGCTGLKESAITKHNEKGNNV